jgi:type I restriction enzyme R subunit
MNEAETRVEHMGLALRVAGWGVLEGGKIMREYPITLDPIEGQNHPQEPSNPR